MLCAVRTTGFVPFPSETVVSRATPAPGVPGNGRLGSQNLAHRPRRFDPNPRARMSQPSEVVKGARAQYPSGCRGPYDDALLLRR